LSLSEELQKIPEVRESLSKPVVDLQRVCEHVWKRKNMWTRSCIVCKVDEISLMYGEDHD